MLEPGFYPKRPSKVAHKETHISHVFLTDDLVYKVKKAVRFFVSRLFDLEQAAPFPQRRIASQSEDRARRVYLAVMPISFDSTGWRLGGWSEPVEYTLIMRRLPERRMLSFSARFWTVDTGDDARRGGSFGAVSRRSGAGPKKRGF